MGAKQIMWIPVFAFDESIDVFEQNHCTVLLCFYKPTLW